jgi:hypothetical protein
MVSKWIPFLCLAVSITGIAVPAGASFHLMQIEQVIGGVDGDQTAQAVQLRMRALGQNALTGTSLIAYNSAGTGPVTLITFPSGVAARALGSRILVATANFANFTSPAAVPDFIMTNPIPASYLGAGSVTFEGPTGVVWRLSWGAYVGPTTGSLQNDFDGDYGPPWPNPAPTTSTQALLFQGAAADFSTTNSGDYALTSGDAVFTSNNGSMFTVQSQATGIPPMVTTSELLPNRPNPFNPTTEIVFTLAQGSHATLHIYDVKGTLVATLVDGDAPAGPNHVVWDGRNARGQTVGSGVYYYRLIAADVKKTRRMVLIK